MMFASPLNKWLWLSALVIALDQASKWLASAKLVLHSPVEVMPMFNLTLMHNRGAAFSFLHNAEGWQRWFFVLIALVVSTVIIAWLRRLQPAQRLMAAGLSLILGGALGNVWDRIVQGYVVDFIDVYYDHWHWPAFNVADSAIVLGAALLIIESFRQQGQE